MHKGHPFPEMTDLCVVVFLILDILTVCALAMHLQFYPAILTYNTVVQYVTSLYKWLCDSRERSNSITKYFIKYVINLFTYKK